MKGERVGALHRKRTFPRYAVCANACDSFENRSLTIDKDSLSTLSQPIPFPCHLGAKSVILAPIQSFKDVPMAEPQLSIRSAKARRLAQDLARRTGLPMNKLVERALQHYDAELNAAKNAAPIDAVWDLAAAGRQNVAANATSAHDDLYDADGLPK